MGRDDEDRRIFEALNLPAYIPPMVPPVVHWSETYSTPDGVRMRLEDYVDMDDVRRRIAALEDELILPLLIEWLRNHGYTVNEPGSPVTIHHHKEVS